MFDRPQASLGRDKDLSVLPCIANPYHLSVLTFLTDRSIASVDMSSDAATPSVNEKTSAAAKHLEDFTDSHVDLVYDHDDEEPELHARTYVALAAMFLLNLVQVLALQGPPAVVRCVSWHELFY